MGSGETDHPYGQLRSGAWEPDNERPLQLDIIQSFRAGSEPCGERLRWRTQRRVRPENMSKPLWPRLASRPINLTNLPSSEGSTYLLLLQQWRLEGLTTWAHLSGLSKYTCVTLPPWSSGTQNDLYPCTFITAFWPSLQGLETVDLSFDLALRSVRLFPLSWLPRQLKKRGTFVRAVNPTLGNKGRAGR